MWLKGITRWSCPVPRAQHCGWWLVCRRNGGVRWAAAHLACDAAQQRKMIPATSAVLVPGAMKVHVQQAPLWREVQRCQRCQRRGARQAVQRKEDAVASVAMNSACATRGVPHPYINQCRCESHSQLRLLIRFCLPTQLRPREPLRPCQSPAAASCASAVEGNPHCSRPSVQLLRGGGVRGADGGGGGTCHSAGPKVGGQSTGTCTRSTARPPCAPCSEPVPSASHPGMPPAPLPKRSA